MASSSPPPSSIVGCIATTADGSITNICQPTSLPSLPPIIRHSKEMYFEQRVGLPPLLSEQQYIDEVDNDDEKEEEEDDDTTTMTTTTKSGKKLPMKWMIQKNSNKKTNQHQFQNSIPTIHSQKCRLYMAPSSIPNSGLGMYSGIHIPGNTYVDFNPQIVIPLEDIESHYKQYDYTVLSNYPWISTSHVSFVCFFLGLLYGYDYYYILYNIHICLYFFVLFFFSFFRDFN